VNSLDLKKLGMTNTDAASGKGGQSAYPPGMLLKLYLYGYLNRIRSSRMLEAECKERLEKMEANKATQLSETDADARLLKKHGQAVAGYNVQMLRQTQHKSRWIANINCWWIQHLVRMTRGFSAPAKKMVRKFEAILSFIKIVGIRRELLTRI
jgi:uncharacterized NAD(P)/FAD-binding protein YdhS